MKYLSRLKFKKGANKLEGYQVPKLFRTGINKPISAEITEAGIIQLGGCTQEYQIIKVFFDKEPLRNDACN